MSDFKILPCAKRWNYPSIDLTSRMVRTCVRGFGPVIDKEEVAKYGTEIFLNHPYMKKGRDLMMKGEFQWDCRGCYEYAKTGAEGFRTPYHETLKLLSGTYGESPDELQKNLKVCDPKYLTSHAVKELEVGLGNLCDMKCVYCTSDWSSMIEAEENQFGQSQAIYHRRPIEENKDFVDAFWKWLEESAVETVEHIHLIGGETLFNSYFYIFMEKLDQIYRRRNLSHKIIVNIFTNLNNENSVQKLLRLLKETHPQISLNLNFSNESVGARAEFIRNGLGWDRAVKNMDKLFDEGKKVLSFSPSFNNLSISSAADFFRFIRDYSRKAGQPVYVGDNYISHPHWLSPNILTEDFIRYFDEARELLNREGKDFLTPESRSNLMNLFQSFETGVRNNAQSLEPLLYSRKLFYSSIINLQKRRGLQFTQTFPEYRDFLLKCKEAWV